MFSTTVLFELRVNTKKQERLPLLIMNYLLVRLTASRKLRTSSLYCPTNRIAYESKLSTQFYHPVSAIQRFIYFLISRTSANASIAVAACPKSLICWSTPSLMCGIPALSRAFLRYGYSISSGSQNCCMKSTSP